MSQPVDEMSKPNRQRNLNLTIAAVTGQVGCLTLAVILLALFGGLWLDNTFDTAKPVFTVGLMIGSIPVTLILMFWTVKATTARMLPEPKNSEPTEESDRARNS